MFSVYATFRSTTAIREDCLLRFASAGDRAVRKHLHGALAVADHDRPQVDLLDDAGDAVDPGEIANPHLILEDQEEAGDDVADQVLRAEPDRQARRSPRPSGSAGRRWQLAQQHQHRDEPDDRRDQAGEDAAERRRAPLPLEIGGRVPPRQLELQMLDREIGGADDDVRSPPESARC